MNRFLIVLAFILGFILTPTLAHAQTAPVVVSWIDNSGKNKLVPDNSDGFRAECRLGTGAFTPSGTYGPSVRQFTYTVPTPSNYCCRVLAFNDIGDSAWSNLACGKN